MKLVIASDHAGFPLKESLLFVAFSLFLYGFLSRALLKRLDGTLQSQARTAAVMFADEMEEEQGDTFKAAQGVTVNLRMDDRVAIPGRWANPVLTGPIFGRELDAIRARDPAGTGRVLNLPELGATGVRPQPPRPPAARTILQRPLELLGIGKIDLKAGGDPQFVEHFQPRHEDFLARFDGLEDRQSEALERRGKHDAFRAAIESLHVVVGHISDVPHHVVQAQPVDLPAKGLPIGRLDAGKNKLIVERASRGAPAIDSSSRW